MPYGTTEKSPPKEFMEKSGLKKGTFYHLVNEYRELLEINKHTMGVG